MWRSPLGRESAEQVTLSYRITIRIRLHVVTKMRPAIDFASSGLAVQEDSVRCGGRIYAYLEEWPQVLHLDATAASPLFVTRDGTPMTKIQMEYRFTQIVQTTGMQSALDRGTALHALRHTFATRAIQDGIPATRLQALLGHESLATT